MDNTIISNKEKSIIDNNNNDPDHPILFYYDDEENRTKLNSFQKIYKDFYYLRCTDRKYADKTNYFLKQEILVSIINVRYASMNILTWKIKL